MNISYSFGICTGTLSMFCFSVLFCESQYINHVRSVLNVLKLVFDFHEFLTLPVIPTKSFRGFGPFSQLEPTAFVKDVAVARQYSAQITSRDNL